MSSTSGSEIMVMRGPRPDKSPTTLNTISSDSATPSASAFSLTEANTSLTSASSSLPSNDLFVASAAYLARASLNKASTQRFELRVNSSSLCGSTIIFCELLETLNIGYTRAKMENGDFFFWSGSTSPTREADSRKTGRNCVPKLMSASVYAARSSVCSFLYRQHKMSVMRSELWESQAKCSSTLGRTPFAATVKPRPCWGSIIDSLRNLWIKLKSPLSKTML